MNDIMAAQYWATNGHLIAGVAQLGFINKNMHTVDLTHGRGVWWQQWAPNNLTRMTGGKDPKAAPADLTADFTALPLKDQTFDLLAFDPPYMPMGTLGDLSNMFQHYGVGGTGKDAITVQMLAGLEEAYRVCRKSGVILTKAGRGISGGKLWRGDDLLVNHGEKLGLTVLAQFLMLTKPRAQKHRGPQQNPRSNYSTLTVWGK